MINNIPFNVKKVITKEDNYIIFLDDSDIKYLSLKLDSKGYSIYNDLIKYSNKLCKSIYEYVEEKYIYLIFYYSDNLTEEKVKYIKIIEILEEIFDNSSFEITLKKKNIINLNHLYQILDRKFTYFEFRIREIETSVYKDDISWIVLSKYNIILDCKVYLYDLQQDIFGFIDKEEIVKYGIVYRNISSNLYQKGKILPFFDLYYAPIGMLFCRYYLNSELYLNNNDFKKKIEKLDLFNQKYFCFMVLYIYILNLNMEINFNNNNISNYLLITSKIKEFMNKFEYIIKK